MGELIGLIGVGRLGQAIAEHLIAHGYDVIGYRRSSMAQFTRAGGRAAGSCAEVTQKADVVLECLPSVSAFESAMQGPDGIASRARRGQIFLSLSTYPLSVKKREAERIAAQGAMLLDCEISGTPVMVRERSAVVFVSGDEAAARQVNPVLDAFAGKHMYLGAFGAASTMKLIANHLLAIHNLAAAEAMLLGARAGLDPQTVIEAIGPSAGSSTMFRARAPMMARRQYEPAPGPFSTLEKYLGLVRQLARESKAPIPLFDTAAAFYDKALAQGRGEQDIAAIFDVLEQETTFHTNRSEPS
ncbi:MAG: NAD(P)-dependent oxidoreductase [Alphaproteobacteria bacterium]|nr:MAG: NAD(P)-dependent oxidoreductase [Alphaproteobacteria bacterium]